MFKCKAIAIEVTKQRFCKYKICYRTSSKVNKKSTKIAGLSEVEDEVGSVHGVCVAWVETAPWTPRGRIIIPTHQYRA